MVNASRIEIRHSRECGSTRLTVLKIRHSRECGNPWPTVMRCDALSLRRSDSCELGRQAFDLGHGSRPSAG